MKKIFIVLSVTISLISCVSKNYKKNDTGVIIKIDSVNIQLQVYSENIIRVTAAVNKLPKDTSLVVKTPKKCFTDWSVTENKTHVIVNTKSLSASVNKTTGEVVFTDAKGAIILQEKQGGGKTFIPKTFEGTNYYSVIQSFESPNDEAFYGLGGQHHGYMNYKGKDVEIAQHNLVAAIPFIYSNKNYGILWDNSSISRFGDPREYSQISNLTLFDKQGKQGGLTATYTIDGKVVKTTTDSIIDYRFLEEPGIESLSKEMKDKGTITWEGSLSSSIAGLHKFLLYHSSYVKLWIDGELLFENWRQNWNPWSRPFTISLEPGNKKTIKLEWKIGGGFLGLQHLNPLSNEEQNRFTLSAEAAYAIDYYFIYGTSADQVISGYRTLTGKATIVPKWAMGFWQSRERYKTQQEIIDIVQTFRNKQIPIDNIVLDWHYWPTNQWGSHKFDTATFPNPELLCKQVHDLHCNIMISVWPKYYEGIDNYKAMKEQGFLYMNNIEKGRLDWVGPGYKNTYYDAFNPKAREAFWNQIKPAIFDKGFDAWWLDATEPDMHSNISYHARKLNMHPTAVGTGEQMFNAFAYVNAKGVYESQRQTAPDKRVFILTRSAYSGIQSVGAAVWSGDIVTRWSDLKDQISIGINFSLSGAPFWTMDIGGFSIEDKFYKTTPDILEEWREIQTRWYQFGAFCPLFRVHGQFPYREIFNIAPESHKAYKSMLYYNNLRYILMPYIYTLAAQTYHTDYTIMRGLIMDFAHDSKVWNINDQYMFGPSLLINPVYQPGATKRSVYLPAGQGWYDLYSGIFFEGGQTILANAPYDRMPIFVKEGSIIPTGQPMQYTNQMPDSIITLFVYGGKDASFTLYADEATNYNYEKGMFSMIPIHYNEKNKTITLEKRIGEFAGMLKSQTFKIVYIDKQQPKAFGNLQTILEEMKYKGDKISIQLKK
ncbi:MAG TPA: glycoside hydrolase family 31 protein [Bacteroidales bacterium]|nr:glycoside hydrolase family 31 protein [Bacteroidales bacterium]HRS17915.1 glycoside hydrolase family 31 protein [Bacteroidales bacterium]